ncbi:MAG: hypothetical protein LIP77_03520 [Planctomycetes bacterium]|nr:hypothetical protein [Planctomycetota bacterium]
MSASVFSVVAADERSPALPPEHDWYGRFLGAWDFDWIDNIGTPKERRVKGEWLFARALEGMAIQDVFLCPSREARKTVTYPDAAYGTTLRLYVPERGNWDVVYVAAGYPVTSFLAEKNPLGDIIQTMTDARAYDMIWQFTEITDKTFHWTNLISHNGGHDWDTQGELFAVRRTS